MKKSDIEYLKERHEAGVQETLRVCREAVKMGPDHPLPHMWLGDALKADHQYKEAVREYEKAHRICMGSESFGWCKHRVMGKLGFAKCLLAIDKPKKDMRRFLEEGRQMLKKAAKSEILYEGGTELRLVDGKWVEIKKKPWREGKLYSMLLGWFEPYLRLYFVSWCMPKASDRAFTQRLEEAKRNPEKRTELILEFHNDHPEILKWEEKVLPQKTVFEILYRQIENFDPVGKWGKPRDYLLSRAKAHLREAARKESRLDKWTEGEEEDIPPLEERIASPARTPEEDIEFTEDMSELKARIDKAIDRALEQGHRYSQFRRNCKKVQEALQQGFKTGSEIAKATSLSKRTVYGCLDFLRDPAGPRPEKREENHS